MKCSYAGILFIAIYYNIKSKQCLMCNMDRACTKFNKAVKENSATVILIASLPSYHGCLIK